MSFTQKQTINKTKRQTITNANNDKQKQISSWLIPAGSIGVLLTKQEPISLLCIETFDMGEQKVDCHGVIQAGLLPDTMVVKSKRSWIGNFKDMQVLDLSLRALGVHIIV